MTDDERSFIRACTDNPADDAPRLVYSEWRDERGQPCPMCDGRGLVKVPLCASPGPDVLKSMSEALAAQPDRTCPGCAGTGESGTGRELRAMVADRTRCVPVCCEPEWGRTPALDALEGLIHVGIRRGLVEYVRCPLDLFCRAADVLKDWPILVVDLIGLYPEVVGREAGAFRFSAIKNYDAADWTRTAPFDLPLELIYGLTAADRNGRTATYDSRSIANWRWDVSRAGVRLLRELGGFGPANTGDLKEAERLWAGRDMMPSPPEPEWHPGAGWLTYDSDFRPDARWSYVAFGRTWQAYRWNDPPNPADHPTPDRSAAWAELPEILRQADRRPKADLQRYAHHSRGREVPITREDIIGDRTGAIARGLL